MHSTKETRGGARINAGRKKGSSVYGETTTAVRIPESLVPTVKNLLDARKRQLEILADHSTAILLWDY
jgi:DNA polymerase V